MRHRATWEMVPGIRDDAPRPSVPQEAATIHYTPTAGHLALIHPDLSDVPVAGGGVDRTQNPEEGPDLRRHAIDDRGRFCRDEVFFATMKRTNQPSGRPRS
jgi:hypothetical protein